MQTRQAIHSQHAKTLDTKGIRDEFLIQNIFKAGEITMTYSHIDRILVGGIMPLCPTLLTFEQGIGKQFGVDYLLERREMGLINIGGTARVHVDGQMYIVGNREALYIGRGAQIITFASVDTSQPAKLYYNCVPAHQSFPTRIVTAEQAVQVELGDDLNSNHRVINKYLVPDVLPTCQLSMGLTQLLPGNLWNSMPCHTHERRMEVYFYFDVDAEHTVFHMMGEPQETRHVLIHNEEAVISPPWSIHSGVGTKSYAFIWGMCGENLTFDDMNHVNIKDIR